MVDERRKHMRFNTDINGEFQVRNNDIQGVLSTDNFSRGGFKATINKKVDLGQTLECEMIFPDTIMPFFSAGKVVWVKENNTNSKREYDIGIHLDQIDPVEKQCLIDYCYKKWNDSRQDNKTEFELDL
ncbi:MAG: PilZ domain-containing protein [Candidatus Omnitrophica bacterium]|nr:PilZ domain-containing protein [Candidatus Omnitrophota bacterium]